MIIFFSEGVLGGRLFFLLFCFVCTVFVCSVVFVLPFVFFLSFLFRCATLWTPEAYLHDYRPLKSLRASVPDSHNSCGRMWIHEFSRFFNNRGLVEVEGQRGGTNFCCDVVGFTVFLRLGCLHVPVMEGRSQYIDVLGLKFAKKNIKTLTLIGFKVGVKAGA